MRHPRGRVQSTTRPIAVREGVVATGRFPLLVCELKVESNRNRNAVAFWARKLGLELRLVQVVAEGALEAHEVWGAPDALGRFVSFAFVQSFHLPICCRVGWQGQGAGEDKPQHHRPLPHVREALRREDDRAEAACAARKMGRGDDVRRERLFG